MTTLITLILAFVIDYFLTASLLALACTIFHWIGIFTIGSFTIAFSWKVATAIWVLIIIFRLLFGKSTK